MVEGRRVLVVDDANLVRRYYRQALEGAGFAVSDALNGVDIRRQSDQVAQALIAMAQRQTINASRRLAQLVVECFEDGHIGLLPRAHRQAGFAVLTAADIPAALVELGYLSNVQDEQLLLQRAHQQRLAASLMRAVDQFFAGPPSVPAAKKT